MSVGLGCFFVLGIRALQGNLLDQLSRQVGENSPDFVLIDVQSDQVDSIQQIAAPFVRRPPRITPLMRGRVVAVAGRQVSLPTREDVRRQGALTREFGLTFRNALESNERLVEGAFWTGAVEGERFPMARPPRCPSSGRTLDARIGLGDRITFDVALAS
jgi:putative ABC transport system permease protein